MEVSVAGKIIELNVGLSSHVTDDRMVNWQVNPVFLGLNFLN